MGIEIIRSDGGLGRSRPTPDMTSGLCYVKYVTSISPGEPAPSFTTATKITSFRSAKAQIESDGGLTLYADLLNIIEDFFRANPNGVLWVKTARVISDPIAFVKDDFPIEALLTAASGEIRQLAVYGGLDYLFATSQALDIHNVINGYSNTEFCPVSAVYQAAYPGSLSDLRALSSNRVTVCIGFEEDRPQGMIGLALGFMSLAKVHQSIAWVEAFRLPIAVDSIVTTWDSEDVAGFLEADVQFLTDAGYLFARKYPAYPGFYWNDSPVCAAATSDFFSIENNRTIDKAIREVRINMMPGVSSPAYTDSDGKLTAATIASFESKARLALENMLKAGELSGYDVYINPEQNVAATSEIAVEISLNIVGVARKIIISIGFTV